MGAGRAARQRCAAAPLLALLGVGFALWAWRIVRTGGARPWGIAGLVVLARGRRSSPGRSSSTEPVASGKGGGHRPTRTTTRLDGVHAGHGGGAHRGGAPGVRRLHRGVVRDVPGEQAARAERGGRPRAIRGKRVALVRADWTRRDPAITQALAAFGSSGVPVYVLYRPGKEPLLLPEVLRRSTMQEALATL